MHCFVSVHCIVMQRSTRDINIVGNRTSKSCGFTSAICCFLYLLNKIEFGDIINKSLLKWVTRCLLLQSDSSLYRYFIVVLVST
jgi:hypothetical protein